MIQNARDNEPIPLTGADCFLRAFDDEIRRNCKASHVSQLVLRLGPGFDAEALQHVLDEATLANPILRAPIRRDYRIWHRRALGAPAYRTDRAARAPLPRVRVHEADARPANGALPAHCFERLNEVFELRRGELLRFDAVRYAGGAGGSDLVMSWIHMLFDGSGSENFLHWLEQCRRGEARPDRVPDRELPLAAPASPLSFGERGERARSWQSHVEAFGAHPLRSPAGPLRRVRQQLRYRVETLPEAETAQVTQRATQLAGFLTPMLFYLAVAIRAHHAVFRARGVDPGSYVVPLPVNLRPKGGEKAVFRTHVSLVWFQVLPSQVEDFEGLIAELKQQRRDAIKLGRVENGSHAMAFARYAPKRLYSRMARRSLAGELCSFFFAYTGEFMAETDQFFGAPIENAFHAAPVPPSPGSGTAFSLRRGRLNLTHVYQRGVFTETELALLQDALRSELLGRSE